MTNRGLVSVIAGGAGIFLMWAAIRGVNPVRALRDILTKGSVGTFTEYK